MSRTDEELIELACDGDVESFGVLYERYYALAVGISRSRLFDVHLAEDAAQESFAIACRNLRSLSNPDRFPQWLGAICRRTASAMRKPRPVMDVRSDWDDAMSKPTSEDRESDAEQLRRALEQLPTIAREMIHLHYFSGLSYEQIGKALGLSSQAIHGRLQRARRTLHTLLLPKLSMGNNDD